MPVIKLTTQVIIKYVIIIPAKIKISTLKWHVRNYFRKISKSIMFYHPSFSVCLARVHCVTVFLTKLLVLDQLCPDMTPRREAGLILGLRLANERRRYFVTMSLIGWAQT